MSIMMKGCYFQKSVVLNGLETPEEVAIKIHMLEQEFFPTVIDKLLNE
jgi:phosphoribosylglycinamide formyltransferase-1